MQAKDENLSEKDTGEASLIWSMAQTCADGARSIGEIGLAKQCGAIDRQNGSQIFELF